MRIRFPVLQEADRCWRCGALAVGVGLLVAACSAGPVPRSSPAVSTDRPYTINGVRYSPRVDPNYDAVGMASWYGPGFHGRKTASGQRYDMNAMTAAHTTLPFGTKVKVTNLQTGRSAILTINDRGPFVQNRIIDVSRRAAERLGFRLNGVTRVRVQVMNEQVATRRAKSTRVRRGSKDVDHFMPTLKRAMESAGRLKRFDWQNPDSGRKGHIMALTKPSASQASACRNYRRTAEHGTERAVYVGRACRATNGSWRISREHKNRS